MKVEVHSAADFLMNLLRVRQQASSLSETQLHSFRGSLIIVLLEKYNNHWYENNPRKGKLTFLRPLFHLHAQYTLKNDASDQKENEILKPSFFLLPKGSAFRCIRINGETSEPLIEKAASNCGLNVITIRRQLPAELTLWIDPNTVCYRIGENGSISVLYDGNRASPSDLDSSGSENFCEISPEINKLVLDFYEKSNISFITKPKRYSNKNRQTINISPPRNYYQSFYQSPSNNQYYQNKAF